MSTTKGAGPVPVRVVVRSRPLNAREVGDGSHEIISVSPDGKDIAIRNKRFGFDRVFDEYASQAQLYEETVKPIVTEVLEGYNCTVFAYGQTSSGKTYTMEGEGCGKDDEKSGVIFRAVNEIFTNLEASNSEFTVRVSVLELYNEELHDLLSVEDGKKLGIFDDSKKGTVVKNLEEMIVRSAYDMVNIIHTASTKRCVAETQLNHQSR
jgi:kinesin family member 11